MNKFILRKKREKDRERQRIKHGVFLFGINSFIIKEYFIFIIGIKITIIIDFWWITRVNTRVGPYMRLCKVAGPFKKWHVDTR